MKNNIKAIKKPATALLNFGIMIKIPPANCITPKPFHIVGETVSIMEHGGSMKFRNLSAPIMNNSAAQIPAMMLEKFIVIYFMALGSSNYILSLLNSSPKI